jgi:uncharacterized protein YaiI (UPF0178 family)
MQIWVDADACPSVIREIIAKAAHNRMITTTFIANHNFSLPKSQFITFYQVPNGFDEADKEIERRVSNGDLVVTADIPLASDVLQRGAFVLTPRGEQYTDQNIRQRLQMRDFMETMRAYWRPIDSGAFRKKAFLGSVRPTPDEITAQSWLGDYTTRSPDWVLKG